MSATPVLVVVSVDPEASHRANEAIRIALGILAGEHEVTIALVGPATKILDAEVEDYVDGEEIVKHLGAFKKLGQPFHVEGASVAGSAGWNPSGVPVVPLEPGDLARLVSASRRVLAF